MRKIRIGTRGSQLALWQAHFTKDILEKQGFDVELNIISTKGDRTQEWNLSFDKIEGKGFFTKEIEEALLNDEADLAVHSCKDMPTENAEGLEIAAYSYRANPADVLLVRKDKQDFKNLLSLQWKAIVGTSSARRKAQILSLRSDLEVKDLRGNVPTRIEKLRSGQYDAIILAAAGIERLNLLVEDLAVIELRPPLFIPAPAQGVLAYQIRKNDAEMAEVCRILHDNHSYKAIQLERNILHAFKGGCQIPLGVYVAVEDKHTSVWISKAAAWDQPVKRARLVFEENIPTETAIVQQFESIQPRKVFISRDLDAEDLFQKGLTSIGFVIEGNSLIDIHPIAFNYDIEPEWIFFTSKNGVNYFFDKIHLSKVVAKIGAINKGTADALRALGCRVDFEGSSSDTQYTAQQFSEIATGKVLLPQAKNSSGVMERYVSNTLSLPVYDNLPKSDIPFSDADILVFTSSMNAQAYFSNHLPQAHQKIIAIGPATEKTIIDLGFKCTKPYDPMNWSLIDEVMHQSSKQTATH